MKRTRRFRNPAAVLVALLLSALLAACASSGSGDMSVPTADRVMEEGGAGSDHVSEDGNVDGDRLIIRSTVVRLEVESTPDAIAALRELGRMHSATVSGMQVATENEDSFYRYDEDGNSSGDGAALRGWVTMRVPTDSFETFVDGVMGIGIVKFQSEASDDVTQEHVDLSARLENLRAQEARLREFFDAAVDVTEMLAIEKELGRVRGEIESLDAQVTYLERQAAMATVTVELSEPRAVVRPSGDSWGFVEALTDGVRGAAGILTGLLTILIATAPLWLLGLILFFPIRALVRRRRAAGLAATTTSVPTTRIVASAVPRSPVSPAPRPADASEADVIEESGTEDRPAKTDE